MVLEPLSRGAVRLGELHLRLSVLEGTVRGMGMAGALRPTARDRALPQLRRRPLRPTASHPLRGAGHRRGLRLGNVASAGRGRLRNPRPVRRRRNRSAVDSAHPRRRRTGRLSRRVAPHRPVADDARRLLRSARCRDRHIVEWSTGGAGDRRRGGLGDGVSTHGQLVHAAEQRTDHRRRTGSAASRVRGVTRRPQHVGPRVPPRGARSGGVR